MSSRDHLIKALESPQVVSAKRGWTGEELFVYRILKQRLIAELSWAITGGEPVATLMPMWHQGAFLVASIERGERSTTVLVIEAGPDGDGPFVPGGGGGAEMSQGIRRATFLLTRNGRVWLLEQIQGEPIFDPGYDELLNWVSEHHRNALQNEDAQREVLCFDFDLLGRHLGKIKYYFAGSGLDMKSEMRLTIDTAIRDLMPEIVARLHINGLSSHLPGATAAEAIDGSLIEHTAIDGETRLKSDTALLSQSDLVEAAVRRGEVPEAESLPAVPTSEATCDDQPRPAAPHPFGIGHGSTTRRPPNWH